MGEQLELFKDIIEEVSRITKKKAKPRESSLSKKNYDLLEHKRILNQEPPPKLVKTNQEYGNKFIPLQVVEQMLSAIYPAHSIIIPFKPEEIQGQIITVVTLRLLHPVLNEWQEFSGMSCVPLIAPENEHMKWNHRNIPAGKGFAILNASKEIGQLFRAEKDDYSDVMRGYFEEKQEELTPEQIADNEMKKRLLTLIEKSKTLESLEKKSKKVDELDDEQVIEAYNKKHIELNEK